MNKAPTNLGYNRYKIILRESNIQPVKILLWTIAKIPKKEYFISTKDIPSYSATLSYTPQVSNYSIPQLFTKKESNYSTQQIFT